MVISKCYRCGSNFESDRYESTCPACYRDDLATKAIIDSEGVYRWKVNNNVPPAEVLEKAGVPEDMRKRCAVVRDRDNAKFFAEYRKAREGYKPSSEELYEMVAAFGPGATVVDVITGKRTRLPGKRAR